MNLPPISEDEQTLVKVISCISLHIWTSDYFEKVKMQSQWIELAPNQDEDIFHQANILEVQKPFILDGQIQDLEELLYIKPEIQLTSIHYQQILTILNNKNLSEGQVNEAVLSTNLNKILKIMEFQIQQIDLNLQHLLQWPLPQSHIECSYPSEEINLQRFLIIMLKYLKINIESILLQDFTNIRYLDYNLIHSFIFVMLFCKDSLYSYQYYSLLQQLVFYSQSTKPSEINNFLRGVLRSLPIFDINGEINNDDGQAIVQVLKNIKLKVQENNILDQFVYTQSFLNEHYKVVDIYQEISDLQVLKKHFFALFRTIDQLVHFINQTNQLLLQILNSVQFKLAYNKLMEYLGFDIENLDQNLVNNNNIQIIVMYSEQYQGFTLCNGQILINVYSILSYYMQYCSKDYKNNCTITDEEWIQTLQAFIIHHTIHEQAHWRLRKIQNKLNMQTGEFKDILKEKHKQLNYLKTEPNVESGQILENLLFGRVINESNYNIQFEHVLLDLTIWNQQDSQLFQNIINESLKVQTRLLRNCTSKIEQKQQQNDPINQ